MEDFFALDGQNAGQNTFGQTGTENDYIILFIHLYKILKINFFEKKIMGMFDFGRITSQVRVVRATFNEMKKSKEGKQGNIFTSSVSLQELSS